jgi:hypothetical protein
VAFDIDAADGTRGIIGVETKYHEHAKAEAVPRPEALARYLEVARRSGAFVDGFERLLVGTDLQQIWLDHLLALAMRQHPSGRWSWARFVLVYPADFCGDAHGDRRALPVAERDPLQEPLVPTVTVNDAVDPHHSWPDFIEDQVRRDDDEPEAQAVQTLVPRARSPFDVVAQRRNHVEQPREQPLGGGRSVSLDVAADLFEIGDGAPQEANLPLHRAERLGRFSRRRRAVATPIPRSPASTSASASSNRR